MKLDVLLEVRTLVATEGEEVLLLLLPTTPYEELELETEEGALPCAVTEAVLP